MDLPGSALPVAGACADMDRVVAFIDNNSKLLQHLYFTLDSHRVIDIAHPGWWNKKDGSPVDPFTLITNADLQSGMYTARFTPSWSYDYVAKLEAQGEFMHFIWPEHCLIGSPGHGLYLPLLEASKKWERANGRMVEFVTKGDNPLTEHFGAFRANIEIPQDPKTQFNQGLVKKLLENDTVFLSGEARSHCVANSLRQLVNEVPALCSKLTILQDCMSDVPGLPQGFYDSVQVIYDNAKKAGVTFANSTDIKLVA